MVLHAHLWNFCECRICWPPQDSWAHAHKFSLITLPWKYMKEVYATAKFVMFALLQSFQHFVILPYSAHLIYNLLSSFTFDSCKEAGGECKVRAFVKGLSIPHWCSKFKCPNVFNTCGVQELYYTSLEFDYTLKLYMKSHVLGMRRANFVWTENQMTKVRKNSTQWKNWEQNWFLFKNWSKKEFGSQFYCPQGEMSYKLPFMCYHNYF
jgi:hypothetical protein